MLYAKKKHAMVLSWICLVIASRVMLVIESMYSEPLYRNAVFIRLIL